ncbi:phosphogluconate dehydrogenase (NAD(+)-dependent, decarboxylating) [Bifidobacterium sp.]|uniref:phosphogluconate dehydrogenase (NAD(+)-dependent, decarboxylating) n=1 Tax=Bifidobacterium sp. TaxID=41200 RepID=UPI0025BB57F4|nr:decarboxylating 6-phosphogluconate dehydrogenase [Bifidobacterium sp.]MCH4208828.1 decarboxylating 6-phosphogluconate dehydrogenase [Bifidobacterium sp.]MCI1225364.1 decarboxylating 6-phosphogluconate dehydrogenase [Bifidobacterium sp.]
MKIGMIGLGRMGGNMATRLRNGGHEVVGYDMSADSGRDVDSLEALVGALGAPRVVWVMVPAGTPTDSTVDRLSRLLEPGDLVVDGGNTRYREDQRHAKELEQHGIHFMDVGTSGGVWGVTEGYALMAGGSDEDYEHIKPIFEALKPQGDSGLVHAGPVGAGHYVKMIHNGIEYGMMQALGEGYAMLDASDLVDNPRDVCDSWREGTVVRSWLLDLLVRALDADKDLEHIAGRAQETGEAKWMIEDGLNMGVPLPVTAASLFARQNSQLDDPMTMKVVAALRNQFGGHAVDKA